MADKIQSVMIFEILGRPPEHLKETLSGIIDKLDGEKGMKVTSRKIHEPKPLENSELYSTFAEVEAEAENLQKLMRVVFVYMPAHIEIFSPSEIKFKNFDMGATCNEILAKLHNYDSVAKTLMFEKNNLINEINQLKQGQVKIKEEKKTEDKKKKRK